MRVLLWLLAVAWVSFSAYGQQTYTLSGMIQDEKQRPLPGTSVLVTPGNFGVVSGADGVFLFENIPTGTYTIAVSFLGYHRFSDTLLLRNDLRLNIRLEPEMQTLREVTVTDHYEEQRKREESLNIEVVNDKFLKQNLGGSLMQSLERLPGVSSIDIGSGQSKPAIRGLGFNRVVVVENGIKHEAQQWGADHGLEVDQYAFDRIEVIKGPASLMYGSDAIGGVIDLKQIETPPKHTLGGNVNLTGKTNNDLAGTSAFIFGRKEKLFFTFRATLLDYADYRVPTDSVDIYSYRAALHNNRLRNTAGKEQNLHFSGGFQNNGTSTRFYVSNVRTKAGFFANTHGLEPRQVDTGLHDKSARDIQFPFQEVNHFKIINRSAVLKKNRQFRMELGYQRNFRQELSPYTNHGYMPSVFPSNMPFAAELERQFEKNIFSGNLKSTFQFSEKTEGTAGINSEYQKNRIHGRGFIIPAFEQITAGAFAWMKYKVSEHSQLQAGIRYDFGNIRTTPYHDWFESPVVTGEDTVWSFLQRAPELDRSFSSLTWSAGYNYNAGHFSLKANAGKSFRMPIAKELAANGVNYHRFSYEKGDPELSPEVSYQLDVGMEWNTRKFAIGITPFLNYFPNYIYLNPGFEHDRLYGNGNQVFYYTESEVFRCGGELHTHLNVARNFKTGVILNYIYSEQLSGDKIGFTLPFSPPASALFHLKYTPKNQAWLHNPYFSVDFKVAAAQNKIVPPEKKTPGYQTLNLGMGADIPWKKQAISLSLQVQNLLNEKYFNHTSYYRLINVPEAGRNVILNVHIPFSTHLK
ncbi:TonB-dependent receptor [Mariniphaga sediminis]|uniref:TonB-dependent receptor n=2 Tax=Mariniphaga sediminis TaxID=1628158 RepID=A0A399D1C0_9BACT|nr:TonB-dependent receptor [Mariniphaga sediminis]RIH65233.1 TonB-dependent receptor [Mariniphaga sediminis]